MKNLTKVTLAATALVGTLALGSSVMSNQVSANYAGGPSDSIVQRIAERFNLSETEVQSVMDEMREEHRETHQQAREDQLTQAVADGLITEEQKAALLTKMDEHHQEMMEQKENWKDMTPEERHEAKESHHDEMEEWAESQGIDLEALRPEMNEGHGKRGGNNRGGMGQGIGKNMMEMEGEVN